MTKMTFFLGILLTIFFSGCKEEKIKESTLVSSFIVWGFSIEGFPITEESLIKLQEETKISPQIIQIYLQWPKPTDRYVSLRSSLDAIFLAGATPCITWEPMLISNGQEEFVFHETISKGDYNSYLIQVAKDIRESNKPVIIRFAHEMNLERYHWGTTKEQFGPDSPSIYINMFRYLVSFFRQEGVHNVMWAFSPNIDSIPNQPWNKIKNYYPGDEYVNIMGMDGYNWAISSEFANHHEIGWVKPWMSFEKLFEDTYKELKKIAPSKPIMVFETASVDRGNDKKSIWIKNALETAQKWGLVGIIWFQSNKEEDWRIQQNDDYSYVPIIRFSIPPFQRWMKQRLDEQERKIQENQNIK